MFRSMNTGQRQTRPLPHTPTHTHAYTRALNMTSHREVESIEPMCCTPSTVKLVDSPQPPQQEEAFEKAKKAKHSIRRDPTSSHPVLKLDLGDDVHSLDARV